LQGKRIKSVVVHNLKYIEFMKSLIRKGESRKKAVAQCCAKQSKIVAGCHD
jgi:hypothetical protein